MVTTALASSAVELRPRPTHHSSAQYTSTGTRRSSRSRSGAMPPQRRAAAPEHLADPPGARIAREGHPDHDRKLACVLVQRDLRAGAGDVLDQAMPRGEAAVQRDPGMPRQQFARFELLGLWHG